MVNRGREGSGAFEDVDGAGFLRRTHECGETVPKVRARNIFDHHETRKARYHAALQGVNAGARVVLQVGSDFFSVGHLHVIRGVLTPPSVGAHDLNRVRTPVAVTRIGVGVRA